MSIDATDSVIALDADEFRYLSFIMQSAGKALLECDHVVIYNGPVSVRKEKGMIHIYRLEPMEGGD